MRVADFDFDLPDHLIAQHPPARRGESRLLVLDRASGAVVHRAFSDLPEYLGPRDCLVLNDTRVFPARLLGTRWKPDPLGRGGHVAGGAVECLLLRPVHTHAANDVEWDALMHPGQKLKPGTRVRFAAGDASIEGEVLASHFHGRRTVRLTTPANDLMAVIERIGHIPLPPYIKRDDSADDRQRYQTVYAHERGSIAAPTAGLHFTPALLNALEASGVQLVRVTLHVGYGTFKPVRVEHVEEHQVDAEPFSVTPEAADALTRARQEKRRIIAVGTTTTRLLESLTIGDRIEPSTGMTDTFIRPGHRFQLVDGLITNFHLPCSSLLMLVAALGGREPVLAAYREAVEKGYRFYSYGDAMLVI